MEHRWGDRAALNFPIRLTPPAVAALLRSVTVRPVVLCARSTHAASGRTIATPAPLLEHDKFIETEGMDMV
jgi:hypothetical protein